MSGSSVTIIGIFETPQKALFASSQLETLLKELFQWYTEHPEFQHLEMYDPAPPPEQNLIEKFDLQTEANFGLWSVRKSISIQTLDCILMVVIGNTKYHPGQDVLPVLIRKLGSTSVGKQAPDQGVSLHLTLTAHASNKVTCQHIHDEIQTAIENAEIDPDVLMMQISLPYLEAGYVYKLAVHQSGTMLTVSGFFDFIETDLPLLIEHLQSQGFTDFDLKFSEAIL